MTLGAHLAAARERLLAAGIDADEARRDAALLARHALGWDAATLFTRLPEPAPDGFGQAFDALVDRRAAREPVAYIRGTQEFWGRDFAVSPAVLIPRPETELIVEMALQAAAGRPDEIAVCDIGTGSGCLAVTLALERPGARVTAMDLSDAALAVARANATRHGVEGHVTFRAGAYLAGAPGPFDLIVSNPPYVTDGEYAALAPEVRAFEPGLALTAGPDGLRDIREILRRSPRALAPGGTLVLEIGHQQAAAVREIILATPSMQFVEVRADLQGIPRTVVARRE